MTATPARIGLITSEFRRAISGPDTGVDAMFGTLARDTDPDKPFETFFDSVADAQAIGDERMAMLSAIRRRFGSSISTADEVMALDYSQSTPVGRVICPSRNADLDCAVMAFTFDLTRNTSSLTLWG